MSLAEISLETAPVPAAAALVGFFRIMALWDVSPEEARLLLGLPSQSAYYAWRRGETGRLSNDTLRRIGYVAGIFKALQLLYADDRLSDGWIKRPNRAFGGQTPLARMSAGDVTDLAAVRAYLDAARAPWS